MATQITESQILATARNKFRGAAVFANYHRTTGSGAPVDPGVALFEVAVDVVGNALYYWTGSAWSDLIPALAMVDGQSIKIIHPHNANGGTNLDTGTYLAAPTTSTWVITRTAGPTYTITAGSAAINGDLFNCFLAFTNNYSSGLVEVTDASAVYFAAYGWTVQGTKSSPYFGYNFSTGGPVPKLALNSIYVGDASGYAAALASTANRVLKTDGGAVVGYGLVTETLIDPLTITNASINAAAAIAGSKLAVSVADAAGATVALASQVLATKDFASATAQGFGPKRAVEYANAATLPSNTLSGTGVGKTITLTGLAAWNADGVAVVDTDRVIIKNYGGTGNTETSNANNGVYVVSGVGSEIVLTRATDWDNSPTGEFVKNDFTLVRAGTANQGKRFAIVSPTVTTIETDVIEFSPVNDPAGSNYTTVTGNTGTTTADIAADTLNVAGGSGISTAVTADTVTVNADLKTNGGIVSETNQLALDLSASAITGTLGTVDGGTGLSIDPTTIADGDLLIGSNAGDAFVKTTLTEGTGISITNAAGSITIAATSTINFVENETPSGTVNGTNDTFTVANTPTAGSLKVYVNGIRYAGGGVDFTLTGASIQFVTAPDSGSVLLADYRY